MTEIQAPAAGKQQAGFTHFIQGDVLSPPLEAEAFPAVIAMSLLDSVPDPLFALGRLDALLEPGGLLLLDTPYSWDVRVTAPRTWWGIGETSGEATVREAERLVRTIPGHGRPVYRFFLDLLLARKVTGT